MNEKQELINQLTSYLPTVRNWIDNHLSNYTSQAKKVFEFNFPRISRYYSKEILKKANVVEVDRVEMIPLRQLGISGFGDFENLNAIGVTFIDTYFINRLYARSESLHFHELVHICQWNYLGVDRFLLLYGLGLMQHGYKRSPLEEQAYTLQARFENFEEPFDVESQVASGLNNLIKLLGIGNTVLDS